MEERSVESIKVVEILFEAILNGNKVSLRVETLKDIIINDFKISLSELDPILINVLPYMLVCYMRSWPGWSRSEDYRRGRLTLSEWFEKFIQYISFKLKYLIQKGFQKALAELNGENKQQQTSNESQYENNMQLCKSFSGFNIDIEGSPKLLNSLKFTVHKENIHLEMLSTEFWSSDINHQQFFSWPFLEIEYKDTFINFIRKMVPDYCRYLAEIEDEFICVDENFIQEVQVETTVQRSTYSVNFIRNYIEIYVQYLKEQNLLENTINAIKSILMALLEDISEIGPARGNKIHDFTQMTFNIGGSKYMRLINSLSTTGEEIESDVAFCEVITPKCSILLRNKLDIKQLKSNATMKEIPTIVYSCTFCNQRYCGCGRDAIVKHYMTEHAMEQDVECIVCKKTFQVLELMKTRWCHTCTFS